MSDKANNLFLMLVWHRSNATDDVFSSLYFTVFERRDRLPAMPVRQYRHPGISPPGNQGILPSYQ
jgi:hypothetical protein